MSKFLLLDESTVLHHIFTSAFQRKKFPEKAYEVSAPVLTLSIYNKKSSSNILTSF